MVQRVRIVGSEQCHWKIYNGGKKMFEVTAKLDRKTHEKLQKLTLIKKVGQEQIATQAVKKFVNDNARLLNLNVVLPNSRVETKGERAAYVFDNLMSTDIAEFYNEGETFPFEEGDSPTIKTVLKKLENGHFEPRKANFLEKSLQKMGVKPMDFYSEIAITPVFIFQYHLGERYVGALKNHPNFRGNRAVWMDGKTYRAAIINWTALED